jgi:hypothetical protein
MLYLVVLGLIMLSSSNESFKTLFVKLKSNALICHVRFVLVSEMVGSSEYLCSAGGKFCNHSTEFLVCVGNRISRFDVVVGDGFTPSYLISSSLLQHGQCCTP